MDDDTNIQKIDLDKVDWRGSREFFESLGEALDRLDDKDEAYDFTWVGKRKAIIEAGAPINKTFRPNVEASKNWETTENLFIEGDNLDALKLLQESYLGKVKMIYIDPPYNTGKDFVYHDNFKADVADYEEATEYKDESGNIQFRKNEKSNGRYHSDWLNMMYPRLKLAKNLLSENGVIFISIGVDEQANLRKLCDEIFGEDNLLANIVWANKEGGGGSDSSTFKTKHEYILCYCRSNQDVSIFGEEVADDSGYSGSDEHERQRGKHKLIKLNSFSIQYSRSLDYPIQAPDGSEILPSENGRRGAWRWSKNKYEWGLKNDFIVLKQRDDGQWNVYTKQYFKVDNNNEAINRTLPPNALIEKFSSTRATKDITELFDGQTKLFDYPKPVQLIAKLIEWVSKDNDIVVDFFSGSGTTAHAVMQRNAEDGGDRKWIMVQLPEETDESSEAFKAGYKTIPDISRERIRRAGDKITSENPDADVDYGFRALTIADSNYKEVYKSAHETTQQELLSTVDNVKEDRSEIDLLYGVLTASALELNRPLVSREIAGSTVYLYDYLGEVSGLIACFADTVSEETIKEIAGMKPLTVVFKDSTFPDSQAKVNLSEHFRIISPDTKVKVI